jgi:uncharacterized protein with von Willebrand factor type A (vWA) domain
LTNIKTVQKSIDSLINLEKARDEGKFEALTKKEALDLTRKIAKMDKSLGGIKHMDGTPGCLFVIDPRREYIAVREAVKLGIPVVALCDTSRSVAVHAGMLMLFLRLLREALGELRVFGFCSDLVEVTGALAGADTEQAVAAALAAPPQGYTDYGQSLASLLDAHGDAIDRRTSVLILGDARCNDLPPRVELLGRLARRSKAIHWLNTEPRKRWDQGDSVIGQYRVHLRSLQACTTLGQLHAAVGGVLRAAR